MKPETAKRSIEAFGRRFGTAHLDFACHAALPLALTPDLLYRLWGKFRRDSQNQPIPRIAVSDLLLSSLCDEVGYELFEMPPEIRQQLLRQLQDNDRFGEERLRAVAGFLYSYIRRDLEGDDEYSRDFAESQSWAALAYRDPQKSVARLAEAFNRAFAQNPSDLMRLATLTDMLAQPEVQEFEKLSIFARAIGHYARRRPLLDIPDGVKEEILQVKINKNTLQVGNTIISLSPEVGNWFREVGKQPRGLRSFEFETAKVNELGEVISRPEGRAKYFIKNLSPLSPLGRGDGGEGLKNPPHPLTPSPTRGEGGSEGLEMVYIPGGTFLMGSTESEDEQPIHEVTIQPFFMSKYPVTQAQYEAVMGKNPASFSGAKRPVEQVTWHEAAEFCQKISEDDRKYRLPSEAEWEYACRAIPSPPAPLPEGEGSNYPPFYFGETITPELVNYHGNHPYGEAVKGLYRKETTEVGIFPPNAFGLYDMHGNVWEWCEDDWHENYQNAPTDGRAWIDENDNHSQGKEIIKLLRGGSWISNAIYCRSAFRNRAHARDRYNVIGFRVVCAVR